MPHDGYAWWYVDALSHDGRCGITLIAFVGSVFSPYYAFARRHGPVDPRDHCALNVALYGPDRDRWAMTERRPHAIRRDDACFAIGPSRVLWDGQGLTIEIDEVTCPLPTRLRGTVRVTPLATFDRSFTLDRRGHHRWRPFAPLSRVSVDLEQPALRWAGDGYFDINDGDGPLERDFVGWHWSRAATSQGTLVSYDTSPRDGGGTNLALCFGNDGEIRELEPLAAIALPPTAWRLARMARADANSNVTVRRRLEDAPFYARSHLHARLLGEDVDIMHESLSLDRFRNPIVQAMLPFRMPRW